MKTNINAGANESLDMAPTFLAQRTSKDMFLAHIMFKLNKFDNLVSTMDSTSDPRIIPMTRQIIIAVMQDGRRQNLLQVLRQNLAKLDDDTKMSAEKRYDLKLETCQNALGEVYSYLDDEFNISLFDTIAPMVSYPAEDPKSESPETQPEEEKNV